MLGLHLQQASNSYTSTVDSPACQRFQELARVGGLSRAFTLAVKLHLYTVLREQREKHGETCPQTAIMQELHG